MKHVHLYVNNATPIACFHQGCKVIGFAGTDEKCKWIKEELGFDFAFNYKKTDVDTALKEAAPDNGVDCYFDNVWFKGLFGSSDLYVINMVFFISIQLIQNALFL